jgi:hypothetical protein
MTLRAVYFFCVANVALLLGIAALATIAFAWGVARVGLDLPRTARALLATGATVIVLTVGALLTLYASTGLYLDHVEPHMATRAASWLHGGHLYHSWSEPLAYSTGYGPLSYLWLAAAYWIFGYGLVIAKIPGLVAFAACLVFSMWSGRSAGRTGALGSTLLFVALAFLFLQTPFWTRPDPALLLGASMGVGALGLRRLPLQALALGVLAGTLANFKIHGPLAVLPLACVVIWRGGWRGMFWATIGFAPAFIWPFLLPGVSWHAYRETLNLMVDQPRDLPRLAANFQWFALIALPAVAAFLVGGRMNLKSEESKLTIPAAIGFALAGVVAAILGAKAGSGTWHLAPLVPWAVWLAIRGGSSTDVRSWLGTPLRAGLVLGWAATVTLLVYTRQDGYIAYLWTHDDRGPAQEISDALQRHPHTRMQMGYGSDLWGEGYRLTFYRPLLAFAGQEQQIDLSTVMDLRSIGRNPLLAVEQDILSGTTRIFLIPRGNTPFAERSYYDSGPCFSDALRQRFPAVYVLQETGSYYDLWTHK